MHIHTRLLISTAVILAWALAVPTTTWADGKTTFQRANFHDFPGGTIDQPSAGTLTRTKQSIHASLALSGLDLGTSYTIWWIIWNDPANCAASPCGLGDLGVAGNAIIYAAGFVTAESGAANIRADLVAGKLPDGMFVHEAFPGQLRRGNGFRVEAHMLLQSHGSIWPGNVDIQITEDGGACNPACVGQQAIAFLPQ